MGGGGVDIAIYICFVLKSLCLRPTRCGTHPEVRVGACCSHFKGMPIFVLVIRVWSHGDSTYILVELRRSPVTWHNGRPSINCLATAFVTRFGLPLVSPTDWLRTTASIIDAARCGSMAPLYTISSVTVAACSRWRKSGLRELRSSIVCIAFKTQQLMAVRPARVLHFHSKRLYVQHECCAALFICLHLEMSS